MKTYLVVLSLLLASPVFGQTVLQVPYDKARFSWDAPVDPPAEGVGVTRWYIINCGGQDVRVDVPATSILVKDVVSATGTYSCTIAAANNFGVSGLANFPSFEAGNLPANVINPKLEVIP